MEANQYALVHGMARTRLALARWRRDPEPVLVGWFGGAIAIALLLMLAVWAVATAIPPDLGFEYLPPRPHGAETEHTLALMGRNSLVLALHAFACIAGFIAGSALPLSAERRSGISRWIHERARPVAFIWVIAVTTFSLVTQAFALGVFGSTLSHSASITPAMLLITAAPHAMLELTAVFLPLAAWVIASRRGDWDQLLAATAVTVSLAIPMLLLSAMWEVQVWPYLLRMASEGI